MQCAIFLIYIDCIICMRSLIFCCVNHETQESADSQIHFLRAKLCYSNTCSNMLLNLKGAFAACCPQVNSSPEKYRVELSVKTSFYHQDHHVPHFWNIFFQSLEHLIGGSWWRLVPHYSFMVSCESRTSTHYSGFLQKWPLYCTDISFPWEDTILGEPSHRTCSCWKQRLLCTWSPDPLHQPAHSAGHAAHNDNGI